MLVTNKLNNYMHEVDYWYYSTKKKRMTTLSCALWMSLLVLVSLAQLARTRTMHNICKVRGSNIGHHKKKKCCYQKSITQKKNHIALH